MENAGYGHVTWYQTSSVCIIGEACPGLTPSSEARPREPCPPPPLYRPGCQSQVRSAAADYLCEALHSPLLVWMTRLPWWPGCSAAGTLLAEGGGGGGGVPPAGTWLAASGWVA